eukprot:SAG31_NODE_22222_length_531_cov_0.803241_2_plen_50_part_01
MNDVISIETAHSFAFHTVCHHGSGPEWEAVQKRAMDAADAVGMKILMDIE